MKGGSFSLWYSKISLTKRLKLLLVAQLKFSIIPWVVVKLKPQWDTPLVRKGLLCPRTSSLTWLSKARGFKYQQTPLSTDPGVWRCWPHSSSSLLRPRISRNFGLAPPSPSSLDIGVHGHQPCLPPCFTDWGISGDLGLMFLPSSTELGVGRHWPHPPSLFHGPMGQQTISLNHSLFHRPRGPQKHRPHPSSSSCRRPKSWHDHWSLSSPPKRSH